MEGNSLGDNLGIDSVDTDIFDSEYTGEDIEDQAWNDNISEVSNSDSIAEELRYKLKEWAIQYRPNQHQIKGILDVINSTLPYKLPTDPRTLMETPKSVDIVNIGTNQEYWHNGIEKCLRNIFEKFPPNQLPQRVFLNINVDGLPLFKSSRLEFWPILFNIYGFKHIKSQVIGIYCGKGNF